MKKRAQDCDGWGGRVASIAILAVLCLGWEMAGATVFDVPPTIGSRKIELTWQPDSPDDPVFNGNTVLRREATVETIHLPGHRVVQLLVNSPSSEVISYAEGETALRWWRRTDQVVLGDLPIPPGAQLTAVSLHGSDRRVMAGLDDGRIVMWRLDGARVPVTVASGVPVRSLLFFPGIRDTTDLRFVSIGVDDTLRVWAGPGRLLGPGYAIGVVGGASSALAMPLDRTLVAVGTRSAASEVRVYDIQTPPQGPIRRLQQHSGSIESIAFSRDKRRITTSDEAGRVNLWDVATGTHLASVETGTPQPRVALSPPFGRLLFVMHSDGVLALHSGADGQEYRAEQVLTGPGVSVTTYVLASDGVRSLIGDANGRVTVVRAGICQPGADQESCFGGYMVWRSPTPDPGDRMLMRIYNYSDSTWTFRGETRAFCDPDSIIARQNPQMPGSTPTLPDEMVIAGPPNGVPYFYSITRFDLRYLEGAVFPVFPDGAEAVQNGFYREEPGGPPVAIIAEAPARRAKPLLGAVAVVPNPYEIGKVAWELAGVPHVEFRHLPESAIIRIYTVGGDLVRVIEHGPGRYGESRDAAEWDFHNSAGRRVASGVYVYQVETRGRDGQPGEVEQGYFTVIL